MVKTKVLAAGLGAIVIWGAIPVLVKVTLNTIPVSEYLFFRFLIGSLIILPWLSGIIKKRRAMSTLLWAVLALDLFGNYFFQTLAMQGLPASWYIVIFALNPVLALVLLRTKLDRALRIALGAAFGGTILFVNTSDAGPSPWMLFCIVVGMLTWVIYTLVIRKFQRVFSDPEITAVTQALSLVSMSVLWAVKGFPHQPVDTAGLVGITVLGAFTPLAYFMFSYALRRMPIFGVSSQYLEPVVGLWLAHIVFGESLNLRQWLGVIVIVISTVALAKRVEVE